jgi:hypothetical protein
VGKPSTEQSEHLVEWDGVQGRGEGEGGREGRAGQWPAASESQKGVLSGRTEFEERSRI